jgi:7-cyano-7-deazaguanine synthase
VKPAIVLLSGGLDSATTLAVARRDGYEPHAITFRYGQRHGIEVEAAHHVARAMTVADHVVVDVDLHSIGGSALTGQGEIPKNRSLEQIGSGIPSTYVPARNTIFLSYALAWAEVISATDIFIGVNALDYSGYPDCRPEYIRAFEAMANLATKSGVEGKKMHVHAPLISMTKADIIRLGLSLHVDYSLTTSCYDPTHKGVACGHCDACLLRLKGFADAGVTDPVRYRVHS